MIDMNILCVLSKKQFIFIVSIPYRRFVCDSHSRKYEYQQQHSLILLIENIFKTVLESL